jgi:hypothetical protein
MTRRNRNATQVSNISAGLLEELDHEIETGERFESEAFEMNSLAEMQADANLTADLEQAAIDSMDSVDLEDTDETPSEYPIYASGDRFTADNLFSGSKRHYYLTVENALTAQESGKYTTKPVASEKPVRKASDKPQGAPRKTGTPVSEVELPTNWNAMKKTEQARFLIGEGVTIGDAARFMGVRFQQVYQAVSYGKMATGDQADA